MFTQNFYLRLHLQLSGPTYREIADAMAARLRRQNTRVFYCFHRTIVPAASLAEARTILQHRFETDNDRPYFFGAAFNPS